MWKMAWYSFLGLLFFVTTVSVASPTDVSLEQLSETVTGMAKSEEEIKRQLEETTNAVIETQKNVEKILKGPKAPGGVPSTSSGEAPKVPISEDIQYLATQIVTAIKQIEGPIATNNTQLTEILNELKEMNKHFKDHLSLLSCPPPFAMLGDECFNVILEDVSWEEARARCLRMGADLAVPNDLNRLKLHVGERYPRKSMRNFWIGGKNQEKVWKWLSGERIDDRFWHTNEPSGNGECLGMFDGWENPLTDFPCENQRRAICERALLD